MRNRQLPLLLAIPLVSLAACNWNEVENGRLGKVQLTPSNCGLPGCDLDDGIAVGGTFDLTMSGTAGVDVSDLQLVSSAPWIVDVISSDGLAGEPTFRIAGNGAGLADLVAIDRYGYEVDYLPVEVADIAAFDVITTADGMAQSTVPGIGEVIEVRGGTQVTLDVEGTSRGRALLGDVQYLVELDPSIAAAVEPGSDVARGKLSFVAPVGTHDLVFHAPGGASQLVRVIGDGVLEPTR